MYLAAKKVLVIGLGKTGRATVKFLSDRKAEVLAVDDRPSTDAVEVLQGMSSVRLMGENYDTGILSAVDLVIPSPGIPPFHGLLLEAVRRGIPVLSELEIASRFLKRPIIAVTGTNGKTTTACLLGEVLRKAGYSVCVAGNIGIPLIACVREDQDEDFIVVEVSSFQLQWISGFRPFIALLLQVTPDHVDYHGSFEEYRQVKARIFANQTGDDIAVLNLDDSFCRSLKTVLRSKIIGFSSVAEIDSGVFLEGDMLYCRFPGRKEEVYPLAGIKLQGKHNSENIMAVIAAAGMCGCSPATIRETLVNFQGLPHRVEFAGEKNGIRFYDDSKGTNVGAVARALDNFKGSVVLLMGGRDKNGDFAFLRPEISRKVKRLILYGEAREKIHSSVGDIVPTEYALNLKEAFMNAYRQADCGDTVLLSPGCASFDEFRNYAERGDCFKRLVVEIAADS